METDSSIEDFTQRIAQAWGVGKKDRKNGAVLFVFIEDRKMYIQVGYGLEGTLPDATAFDITERHIKPHFRRRMITKADWRPGSTLFAKQSAANTPARENAVGRKERRPAAGTGCSFLSFFWSSFCSRSARRRAGATVIPAWADRLSAVGPAAGWSWSSGSSGGGFSGFSGGGGSFGGGGAGSSW